MVSYTYRYDFARDLPATLDKIRQLGITDMEFSDLFGHSSERLRSELDSRGMRCSSYGVGYRDLQTQIGTVIDDAEILGASYVRVAWIPHEPPFGRAQAEEALRTFDTVGRRLREHGLRFCYHNHGYEFAALGDGTLFDLMVRQSDPDVVSFELDILWAHFPGQDPADLLDRYPDRFRLMHLKDLRKGVTGDLSGHTAPENDVALGDGQLDLPKILHSARRSDIEHYYIEDESPDFATQVPRSLAYLKTPQVWRSSRWRQPTLRQRHRAHEALQSARQPNQIGRDTRRPTSAESSPSKAARAYSVCRSRSLRRVPVVVSVHPLSLVTVGGSGSCRAVSRSGCSSRRSSPARVESAS
jgi:sugar phosphate isomerase/epimerase